MGAPPQKEIPMVSTIIFRVHMKFWRGKPQPKPVHKIWISVETFHTKTIFVRPTETRQNATFVMKAEGCIWSIKVAHGDPEGEPPRSRLATLRDHGGTFIIPFIKADRFLGENQPLAKWGERFVSCREDEWQLMNSADWPLGGQRMISLEKYSIQKHFELILVTPCDTVTKKPQFRPFIFRPIKKKIRPFRSTPLFSNDRLIRPTLYHPIWSCDLFCFVLFWLFWACFSEKKNLTPERNIVDMNEFWGFPFLFVRKKFPTSLGKEKTGWFFQSTNDLNWATWNL